MMKMCKKGHTFETKQCKECWRIWHNNYRCQKRLARGLMGHGTETHCPSGHPYIGDNLLVKASGGRQCRMCNRSQAYIRCYGVDKKRDGESGLVNRLFLTREQKLANKRKWQAARNAMKRAAFVENVDPLRVFERDKGACGICSMPIGSSRWEIDHIMPLSRGGEHSYKNVQLAHATCNRKKWAIVDYKPHVGVLAA